MAQQQHHRQPPPRPSRTMGVSGEAPASPMTIETDPVHRQVRPVPKPRTIKPSSSLSAGLRPVPPARNPPPPPPAPPAPPAPPLVHVRSTHVDRQPVDVIIDLNNSLWRNIHIQDMEKSLRTDDVLGMTLGHVLEPSSSMETSSRLSRPGDESGNEADFDSINVQMEDITSSDASEGQHIAGTFVSVNTGCHPSRTPLRMGPECVVPEQYANSPIVHELAKPVEERPWPPSISHYTGPHTAKESPTKSAHCPEKKVVSLLEKIVRTHPIWYLQHIGRPTATHLLRQMEPGNFIVRASSKPGCMAISVRLPDGHDTLTDHYVVQYARGNVIRLESSPYSFRSLPLLIEHYCMHPEELQVCLRLPYAILTCETTKELRSLALLGQDFWTSETALMRSSSRASNRSVQSTSFMNLDECIPKITPSLQPPPDYRTSIEIGNGLTKPKKRSSIRRDSGSSRVSITPSSLRSDSNLDEEERQNDVSASSTATKADRLEEPSNGSGRISRSERRTQSVRTKSVNPAASESASSSTGKKSSFLKSLLFGGGSNSSQNRREPITQLAHCQYFVPIDRETMRSSKSAFEIGSPSKGEDWSKKHHTSQMSTFKPSYDEVVMSARVCPLPMRRERSDLCASSVMRLARHTERSPGPVCTMSAATAAKPLQSVPKRQPLRPPETACDPDMITNCIDELRRRRLQSVNESQLDPSSAGQSSAAAQVSLRERNSRVSGQRTSDDVTGYTPRASRRDHRMSVPNLSPEPSSSVIQSAKALREKLGRNGDGELSTINEGLITPVIRRKQFNQPSTLTFNGNPLSSIPLSKRATHSPNVNSPCTLISRGREALEALFAQQRNTSPPAVAAAGGLERRFNSERGVRSGRESDLIWRRANNPSSSDEKKPPSSSSLSERSGTTTVNAATTTSASSSTTTVTTKSSPPNRGSCFFPNKPAVSWSAVNSELKSKQKIAKVRPTLHSRTAPVMLDAISATGSKTSEYAQLTEFSSYDAPKQDQKRDDDSVSVAGTVFNEPWDSNVWENLLDLANHGDDSVSPRSRRISDVIQEEDSDSDRTPGGSTHMHESEDELDDEMWASMTASARRTLPSDRVKCKAWEHDDISNYGTIDSHLNDSFSGTLRRSQRRPQTPPHSIHSLPRAFSRFSQQIGSLDDLPLSLPTLSPHLSSGRKTSQSESSMALQSYVERLAEDENTVFGATLKRFIECTVQSEEADPRVVVRNVRQFINGIKNYLVKHGEGDLHALIDQESAHLNANQILNIDAILEAVLHKLLLKRVKPHLYHVMVREHSRAGGLQALSVNIAYVRSLSLSELGFSDADQLTTPSASVMEQVKNCLRKMQHHYSPLKKLENLLRAISIVLSIQSKREEHVVQKTVAADDLVRWLVYILARSSTVGCEVEAWYMWELLPQQMITKGDAAYYLTALFSAIHILKSNDAIKRLAEKDEDMVASMDLSRQFCSPTPYCTSDAFVKVAIPDEVAGCIRYATFPGVPQMTTGKLCRVIAHQQGITNPEDHGLYLIVNGYETCLLPHECPDAIRDNLRGRGKPHLFAYKRHDAKIGWPRQVMWTPG